MKKVVLCAAVMMVGAISFAQTSQTTTTGHTAATSQDPVGANGDAPDTANTGSSRQEGDNQRVQARQQGENNSIETIQSNGAGVGGNQSTALQLSSLDGFTSRRNVIYTEQVGTGNQAFALQVGDDNDAVIEQGLNDDTSSGNSAYIRQVDPSEVEEDRNNFAGIQQDGVDNSAFTDQNVSYNDANTIQYGERNISEIFQDSESQPSDGANGEGHDALVEQLGDDNQSSASQIGFNRNLLRSTQIGNSNSSEQSQNSFQEPGVGNTAVVNQGGAIGGFFAPEESDLNDLDTDIDFSAVSGDSFDGVAFQDQSGSGNDATINQFGLGNDSRQTQSGSENTALTIQTSEGGGNISAQSQVGWSNNAELGQAGAGNLNYQVQHGDSNNSLVSQNGTDNVNNTFQYGNYNDARVAQQGVHNAALIVQTGGQSYSVQQNLYSAGGNNQVDAQQTTAYGTFGDSSALFHKPGATPGLELDPHYIPGLDPLHDGN